MKLTRLDIFANYDYFYDDTPAVFLEKDECVNGDYIRVEDLNEWLKFYCALNSPDKVLQLLLGELK